MWPTPRPGSCVSLSDSETAILSASGTAADTTLRRQAVAISLNKSGKDVAQAQELLVGSYLAVTQPSFHLIPRGDAMASETAFTEAYEALAYATAGFHNVDQATLASCLEEHPATLAPLRMIIGFTIKEFAAAMRLAHPGSRATEAMVKQFERQPIPASETLKQTAKRSATAELASATVRAVMDRTILGVTGPPLVTFHSKLDKHDTLHGWSGVTADAVGVPYSALLYQRYVGGVWRQVQDAYSEAKGDNLAEFPVVDLFDRHGVPYWRSPAGARGAAKTSAKYGLVPGPDFVIPDVSPTVVLESKIGEDGGTVRDKASRIHDMARAAEAKGLVPCAVIDGKGWGERKSALLKVIVATQGRTYTLSTLPMLLSVPEIAALCRQGDALG